MSITATGPAVLRYPATDPRNPLHGVRKGTLCLVERIDQPEGAPVPLCAGRVPAAALGDPSGHDRHFRDVPAWMFIPAPAEATEAGSADATAAAKPQRQQPPRRRGGTLRLTTPKDTRTEAEKQASDIALIARWGYEVIGIGQSRRQAVCLACLREHKGDWKQARVSCYRHDKPIPVYTIDTGNTEGAPDCLVRHNTRWPVEAVLPVERKRVENSPRRAKQLEFAAKGWYRFIDNTGDFLRAIVRFETEVLQIEPHQDVLDYLRRHGGDGGGGENNGNAFAISGAATRKETVTR